MNDKKRTPKAARPKGFGNFLSHPTRFFVACISSTVKGGDGEQ